MTLERLQVHRFRNITSAQLALHPKLNLFVGKNGSGKSSLLEAIYLLSTTRSFRTHQFQSYIQEGQDDCVVNGQVRSSTGGLVSLGIQRNRQGYREFRIDGERQHQASLLAHQLPVLILGAETLELLVGAPAVRRSFINWGLFHVKPDFTELWMSANHCLKQRNQLLRVQESVDDVLLSWSQQFVKYAEMIDIERSHYFKALNEVFTRICDSLLAINQVKCSYLRGWNSQKSLQEVLRDQESNDLLRGYTQSGFHRADLRITVRDQPASQVCSRGELKLMSWALVLSQGALSTSTTFLEPHYLVDDLTSELDSDHQKKICDFLIQQKGQVLATGTDGVLLGAAWKEASRKLFHVKQGTITDGEGN